MSFIRERPRMSLVIIFFLFVTIFPFIQYIIIHKNVNTNKENQNQVIHQKNVEPVKKEVKEVKEEIIKHSIVTFDKECMSPQNKKRDLQRYPVLLHDMGNSIYHPDPARTRCPVPWEWSDDVQDADAVIFNTLQNGASSILNQKVQKCQKIVLLGVESPVYYPWMLDKTLPVDITMDFRLLSDVPIPYVPSSYLTLFKTQPEPIASKSFISAFISNCGALNNREIVQKEIMDLAKVDSFGACHNNAKLPDLKQGEGWVGQKLSVLSKYKFTLAFENSNAEDYVTEKLFQPLQVGCVPVYLGASNIHDFVPNPKAVIRVSDFETTAKLVDYLNYLDKN
ncbi:glycoprotein 3-alpha-L-fucosyltransferase A [Acrasis kona]|uniref:Fucosyltransferase n=1 Tax=Acrasis kona TaxID=1008807 RepID=A0AAW2Z499_9EUKA